MGRHELPAERQVTMPSIINLLNREPAFISGIIAALLQLLSVTVTHWDTNTQGAINAVIVAVMGLITAWSVSKDGALAALTGLGKALIALGLAFGLSLSPNLQTMIMIGVTVIGAFLVRDRVTAKVPA